MIKHFTYLLFFVFRSIMMYSQVDSNHIAENLTLTRAVIIDGDTIPEMSFPEMVVLTPRFSDPRKQAEWLRTKRYVVKMYPYARTVAELMKSYQKELKKLKTENEKKQYLKKVEEELKVEFEGEIKNMTVLQGKILIKLIDRETKASSFQLIKQMRSGFTAFCWQSLAKLFGQDLKSKYDSRGKDRLIEDVVKMIESGELKVTERKVKTTKAQRHLKRRKQRKKDRKPRKRAGKRIGSR